MSAIRYVITIDNAFDVIVTRAEDGKQIVATNQLIGDLLFQAVEDD